MHIEQLAITDLWVFKNSDMSLDTNIYDAWNSF
jgi:hypothetical protein